MTRKLRFLFKSAVAFSLLYGLFVLFFLQEVSIFGDSFLTACEEKSISLPLKEPRIVVDVSDSTLSIYEGEKLVRRYDIATGDSQLVGSLRPNTDSTPVGEYHVIRKAVREDVLFRGSRFLELDFPSDNDIEAAWDQGLINAVEYERYYDVRRSTGKPPTDLAISRPIGIRGNYFAISGAKSTNGSIALSNGDINEIFDHIPLGTPVVIQP